jgi:hypothetical protein
MASKNYPTPRLSLGEAKEQFKIWRITKSPRPIPEKLWQAAVCLTATLSISQISQKLVLEKESANCKFGGIEGVAI